MTQLETQNLPKESSKRKLSECGWILKFFFLPISVLDIEQELEWNQWGLQMLSGGGNRETCHLPSGNMSSTWLLPGLGIYHLPPGSGLSDKTTVIQSHLPPVSFPLPSLLPDTFGGMVSDSKGWFPINPFVNVVGRGMGWWAKVRRLEGNLLCKWVS